LQRYGGHTGRKPMEGRGSKPLPSWADGPAVDRPVRSSRRLLTEGGVVVSTTPTQKALRRLVAKLAKQSPADIQAGNPGEAGHTGAGIKPGGRYDLGFNAHPTIGCCDI
jgi:hypothetical protein